jgi:hypothetical protein
MLRSAFDPESRNFVPVRSRSRLGAVTVLLGLVVAGRKVASFLGSRPRAVAGAGVAPDASQMSW